MLIVGVAVLAALLPVARRSRTSLVFAALAMALLALPTLVDAGWLTALAIALAVPLGSYALTGRFKRPPVASPVGRAPWVIPIAALDLLFLGFVAVQADVLLASDKDRLLRSTGLSYAEYARQGFWQLLIVTGLVLVVVAVALRRLYLYEEAYGWTRLRLWVHAFELWMGLVIVLIAIAGIRLKAAWLPRAIAASGAAGLLALGLLNPDGFIAARDVHHFRHTGGADLACLSGLSADAVPALDRLPEPQRSCALRPLADALTHDDSWAGLNLSRTRARALLRRHPIQRSATC